MRTVYVATRRFVVGEQITAESCRSFQKIKIGHDPNGILVTYSNPNRHMGKFFHRPIEVGEYLVRDAIKKRRPKLPKFKVGDRVKLMNRASYYFDCRHLVLLPGTILKVSDVEVFKKYNLHPRYELEISLGEKSKPIAKIYKREPVLSAAPPPHRHTR